MPVPTKMSSRSSFLMKPNLYAGHAVSRKPSGTAAIHASTRQYQWTFARGAGAAFGAAGTDRLRRPRPSGAGRAPLDRSAAAVAATVADTPAAVRTGAGRVAPSSVGAFSVRRGGGAIGAGAPVRAGAALPRAGGGGAPGCELTGDGALRI